MKLILKRFKERRIMLDDGNSIVATRGHEFELPKSLNGKKIDQEKLKNNLLAQGFEEVNPKTGKKGGKD